MEGIRSGKVASVLMSPNHGFPTYPQESVEIGAFGIPGDAHSGPERESFRNPGTTKPSDRPISIVAKETYDDINSNFGLNAQPGDFNEQVVIEGLGNLSDVRVGDRVSLGNVLTEVVDYAWPCDKLEAHLGQEGIKEYLEYKEDGNKRTKRGILTRVLEEGTLTAGEDVFIIKKQTLLAS